jgi:uncharacterized membrane protein (UPF0182 family)
MRRYFWPIVLIVAALAVLFGGALVALWSDWLWFADLGYGAIFSTIVLTRVEIGLLFGFLFFAIIYGNLWYARRIAPPPSPMSVEQQLIERLGRLARRSIGLLLFLGSIVISAVVGLEAATHWETWLKYVHSTSFGVKDPLFGQDVGFYVFVLPFLNYLYHWLFFALIASTIAAAALHYADEAIEAFGNRLQFAPKVKAHLSVLVAAMFFLKAWGYRLAMYQLPNARGNLFDGASYADVQARVPALWILLVISVIAGVLVLINIYRRGIGYAVAGLVLLIGASIVIGGAYPAIVQEYSVKPNELDKETPYIRRAVDATQAAYGLTDIASREFAADDVLTPAQVSANSATIENIRLWDQSHLQDAYNQIQTLQPYYDFADVDVDRYWLTDKASGQRRYRQVWLSARELKQSALAPASQTWPNLHTQYTHGYGFCMSPVNEISTEGMPAFFVYDIPPKTTVDLPITRPEVYFGELTDTYVFVKTKAREFDYPSGSELKTTRYAANSGVGVGSFIRKLLFAFRFSDVNILLSENIQPDSRILFTRNVRERARSLFPFLRMDNDPYLVTSGGRMYWFQDAYTQTDAYPYSQHLWIDGAEVNYIRNSVKIVTDAYTGGVTAYVMDKPHKDPIIKTYAKIFPGVFKPISQMPREFHAHLRYPEDLFRVQAEIFKRYHQTDPTVYYRNSDLWDTPTRPNLLQEAEGEGEPMEPYYVIMKLPNGQSEEFILMTPFIRKDKYNMVSWMCAKCDPADYGRMVLYLFPKDKNVYGPSQIVARASQDPVISPQISLWSQRGSGVSTGNLLVVPIESSLLYVMPIYLESTATKIPELKRVIVALGNRIAMAPTLRDALTEVVGGQVSLAPKMATAKPGTKTPGAGAAPAPAISSESSRLVDQAITQYDKAIAAQRRGDWAEYGRQIQAMRETLDKIKASSR